MRDATNRKVSDVSSFGLGDQAAALQPAEERRACLFVLGMHRSGTSAVCGVLNKLGAERPVREMPPHITNEKGFFEPIEIVAIHDRILESAGLLWFDWEAMPQSWYHSAQYEIYREELVSALKEDFPDRGPLLVKDPRICRFVDLWLDIADRVNVNPFFIFQFRHPIEVAQSLKARDDIPIAQGLLIWLRYNLDAEQACRGKERSFVNFDNLLGNWETELGPTINFGDLRLPRTSARAMAEAGNFLDKSLRHQHRKHSYSENSLHNWFASTFTALQSLRDDPHDRDAMAQLDEVRAAFEAASSAFSPAFQQLLLQVEDLEKVADRDGELRERLSATQAALESASAEARRLASIESDRTGFLQVKADRASSLELELERLHKLQTISLKLAERVPGMQLEIDGLHRALAYSRSLADQAPELEAKLLKANALLAKSKISAERISFVESELITANQQIIDLQHQLANAKRRYQRSFCKRVFSVFRIGGRQ